MGFAAVDDLAAVAAPGRQRTSRCQSARLLPPERGASLHDVRADAARGIRRPDDPVQTALSILESYCQSGHCGHSSIAFPNGISTHQGRGCRRCRPSLFLRPPRAVTPRTRTSNGASLHPCLPSLAVSGISIGFEHGPTCVLRRASCPRSIMLRLRGTARPRDVRRRPAQLSKDD